MKKRSKKKKKKKLRKNKILNNLHKSELIGETQTKFYYKIGQSVIVKNGVPDPDYGTEIGGWKGKIYNIENADDPFIDIEWDYETQEKIPKSQIKACEKNNLDYTKMRLLASDVEPDSSSEKKDDNKILLKTMTQEIYMLARIYYDLFDREKVQTIFSKLRCMDFDTTRDCWVWLYKAETEKLKFEGSYYDIPIEHRPIILGLFHSNNDDEMYLNVNSFERAKKAIVFFDKYIPRTVAKVTDMEVLNKIFDSYDGTLPNHDDYFENKHKEIIDQERTINELKSITSSTKNPLEKLEVALKHLENSSKQSLPELERFPIHFYEDGLAGLEGCLPMRETIALQHWAGNKDYTFYDIMQKIIPKMPPIKLK
jgi:hypothetical protein